MRFMLCDCIRLGADTIGSKGRLSEVSGKSRIWELPRIAGEVLDVFLSTLNLFLLKFIELV